MPSVRAPPSLQLSLISHSNDSNGFPTSLPAFRLSLFWCCPYNPDHKDHISCFLFCFFFNTSVKALPKTSWIRIYSRGVCDLIFFKYFQMIPPMRQIQFIQYYQAGLIHSPWPKFSMVPIAGKIKSKSLDWHLRPSTIESTRILPVIVPIIASHITCAKITLCHYRTFSAFFHHHVFVNIVLLIQAALHPCLYSNSIHPSNCILASFMPLFCSISMVSRYNYCCAIILLFCCCCLFVCVFSL